MEKPITEKGIEAAITAWSMERGMEGKNYSEDNKESIEDNEKNIDEMDEKTIDEVYKSEFIPKLGSVKENMESERSHRLEDIKIEGLEPKGESLEENQNNKPEQEEHKEEASRENEENER